mmetsp:Transcript_21026/g.32247  ORF Transcript_21026/g.32247 Transcript_21026/m.32247 type:complete len:821 (+) Transcript_21026:35-2497(+)
MAASKRKKRKEGSTKEKGRWSTLGGLFIIVLAIGAGIWFRQSGAEVEMQDEHKQEILLGCLMNGNCSNEFKLPRCGIVLTPSARIASLLGELVVNVDHVVVMTAKQSEDGVILVRAGNRSTLLALATNTKESVIVDESALALNLECSGSVYESERIQALRKVVQAVTADNNMQPFSETEVSVWRESLLKVGVESVDVRGLFTKELLFSSAATVLKSETPLLHSARLCQAPTVRVWLQLGANPGALEDDQGRRALDLALLCESRSLFPTAAELIQACGVQCFVSDKKNQIGPLHYVLMRWAAAHFATRPKPNPFNLLLDRMLQRILSLQDGEKALLATTSYLETPLHVAVAKRNVEGTRLLLSALERANLLEQALDSRDRLGGHTPLALAFAWQTWAVTVPRILTSNGGDASDLKLQALDGNDDLCEKQLATTLNDLQFTDIIGGIPLMQVANTLVSCGFLSALVILLLDSGARIDVIDHHGLSPLAHAHPCLVGECESNVDHKAVDALRRAARRDGVNLDKLLAATADRRNLWYKTLPFFSNVSRLDNVDDTLCDAIELAPSTTEIANLLLEHSVPAIVRDALDNTWDKARIEWMPVQLAASARGADTVRVGTIPYASAFAVDERIASVVDAVEVARSQSRTAMTALSNKSDPKAPTYLFEQIRWDSFRDHSLGSLVHDNTGSLHPMLPKDTIKHNAQFYIGHPLSGAPVHYHSHAANALIHGLKRWLLFPPAYSFYSKEPAINWLQTGRLQALRDANISFLTCLQPPDSVLFLPAGWGHATLNLAEDTVGAAYEFHYPGEIVWSMEDRATHLISANRRL